MCSCKEDEEEEKKSMTDGHLQFQLCPLDVTNITMTIQVALQGKANVTNVHTAGETKSSMHAHTHTQKKNWKWSVAPYIRSTEIYHECVCWTGVLWELEAALWQKKNLWRPYLETQEPGE